MGSNEKTLVEQEKTRRASVAGVESALQEIRNKLKSKNLHPSFLDSTHIALPKRKTDKEAGDELCNFMDELVESYVEGHLDSQVFKDFAIIVLGTDKQANELYKKYKKSDKFPEFTDWSEITTQRQNTCKLRSHRKYNNLVVNLLLAVLSIPMLGIPYSIGVALTGRLGIFKPKTDTAKKMDVVLSEIEKINKNPGK